LRLYQVLKKQDVSEFAQTTARSVIWGLQLLRFSAEAFKYLTHPGSEISNHIRRSPILEHPSAIIASDIAKGCSKSAVGDG
jgi:hypothetical protein